MLSPVRFLQAVWVAASFVTLATETAVAQSDCTIVELASVSRIQADATVDRNFVCLLRSLREIADENSQLRQALTLAQEQVQELEVRLAAIEARSLVEYGDAFSLRDAQQPTFMLTRHGAGGFYANVYPEGHEGLGIFGSTIWFVEAASQ